MKLISWNVNGIRAAIKKGFLDYFNEQNADIFCLHSKILISYLFFPFFC